MTRSTSTGISLLMSDVSSSMVALSGSAGALRSGESTRILAPPTMGLSRVKLLFSFSHLALRSRNSAWMTMPPLSFSPSVVTRPISMPENTIGTPGATPSALAAASCR